MFAGFSKATNAERRERKSCRGNTDDASDRRRPHVDWQRSDETGDCCTRGTGPDELCRQDRKRSPVTTAPKERDSSLEQLLELALGVRTNEQEGGRPHWLVRSTLDRARNRE